ncbi:hypothetical protein M3J09_005103 [Ascochyta lentis]
MAQQEQGNLSADVNTVSTAVVPSRTPFPDYEADDSDKSRCPCCRIRKVLAESRLHRGWLSEDDSHHSAKLTIEGLQYGSMLGCNVCGLVLDAIVNTRGAEVTPFFRLTIDRRRYQRKYQRSLPCVVEIRSDNQTLSVFMAEGMDL